VGFFSPTAQTSPAPVDGQVSRFWEGSLISFPSVRFLLCIFSANGRGEISSFWPSRDGPVAAPFGLRWPFSTRRRVSFRFAARFSYSAIAFSTPSLSLYRARFYQAWSFSVFFSGILIVVFPSAATFFLWTFASFSARTGLWVESPPTSGWPPSQSVDEVILLRT